MTAITIPTDIRLLKQKLFLLAAVAIAALSAPMTGTASAIQTVTGADYLAPVTPYIFEGDLRDLPRAQPWQPGDAIKEIPKRRKPPQRVLDVDPRTHGLDPLLENQRAATPGRSDRAFNTPLLNKPGQGYSGVNPPDTVGDVGTNYYIQMINSSSGAMFSVYHKSNGNVAAGPITLDSMGSGNCSFGKGDPIVLYDELANRWLLSEFSISGNELCVYVSMTNNPVSGGWYNYNFVAPNFPDYPKYSVWPDAYYLTSNESTPAIYALDRAQMVQGQPAGQQRFSATSLAGFGFNTLTPADHDGTLAPPAGLPGIFMRHRDTESHFSGSCSDAGTMDCLEVFEFHVDWTNPGNSSFGHTQNIPVAEFDSDLCGLTSLNCFPQPGSAITLDPLREVIMWRLQYRNMDGYEALVGNFVTDVNGLDHGGIRWFEARRTGTAPWSLEQEGTYAPDNSHRWMGAISMDGSGNIALGYNISDASSVFPGLRYAGRLATDPAGALPQGEHTLVAGSLANGSNRYGDYSAMSIDPVDGCSFWFTGEYNAATTWSTRIGSFRFDTCTGTLEPDFTLSSPSDLSPVVCAGDNIAFTVDVGSIAGFSDDVTLSYSSLPGGFSENPFNPNPVSAPGSSDGSVDVSIATPASSYPFEITGSASGSTDKSLMVSVEVLEAAPGLTTLLAPADGATEQSTTPVFSWSPVPGAQTYTIEIATDPAFNNIVESVILTPTSYSPANPLIGGTEYFWRVHAGNLCGTGGYSSVFSFTTALEYCSSPGLGFPPSPLLDTLVVTRTGEIQDMDVLLDISHTWVEDVSVNLTHAATGISVTLIDILGSGGSCSGEDILAVLDDEAATPVDHECSPGIPAINGSFTPTSPLSAFDNKDLAGTWQLSVSDAFAPSSDGILNRWCLIPTLPSADLAISITENQDPAIAGSNLVYTIKVDNAGPNNASNVLVTDNLPAGSSFLSSSGCSEDPAGAPSCSLGTIVAGGSKSYTLTVKVDSDISGIINNAASVTSDTDDPNLADNSTSEDTTVNTSADLVITKSEDTDPVMAGSTLTYTVRVDNGGPSNAGNVLMTDTLPAGVVLVSAPGCNESPAGVVNCSAGTVSAGDSATYILTVKVDAGSTGIISNAASVVSTTADPDLANNATTKDTAVIMSADLILTKSDDIDPILVGNTLTYSVQVDNAGPSDATDVVVTDTLPNGVSLVTAPGCTENPAGTIICPVGTVEAGNSAAVDIAVTVDNGGIISNLATVGSGTGDPDSSNNEAQEETRVTVAGAADLGISILDDLDPVSAGGNLTYTLTVDNAGPLDAQDVVVTDTLPPGVTLLASSGCAEDPAGVPSCTLGTITSGNTQSFTVVVAVDAGTRGDIANSASVSSSTEDPTTLANNSATEITYVQPDCNGSNATLSSETIAVGGTVICNVGNILVQDLTLGGSLLINKTGNAQFQETIDILDGGKLEVRETAVP